MVVHGAGRLLWDQAAEDVEASWQLAFRLEIDGEIGDFAGVTCSPAAGPDGYECGGPLPPLSEGIHHLSVWALVEIDGEWQGRPSAPLRVRVAGRTDLASTPDTGPMLGPGDDAPIVMSRLTDVTDVAPLPDGRVLVAERAGRVSIADGPRTETAAVVTDVTVGGGHGLLSLAVDPAFETTGLVFAAYSSAAGLRVARFELAGNVLMNQAVVVEGVLQSANQPRAVLRVSPERALYLALDDQSPPGRAAGAAEAAGKVLRFALDGTTPADQAAAGLPVILGGVRQPTALVWTDRPSTLWVADTDASGAFVLHRKPIAAPVHRDGAETLRPEVAAAAPGRPSSADRTMAGLHLGRLGALRVDMSSPVPSVHPALASVDALNGDVRAVASAPDGTLYVATSHTVYRFAGRRR